MFLQEMYCTEEYHRGISSNGRALALHARGTGIDTRILQQLIIDILYRIMNYTRSGEENDIVMISSVV